jgi:hypothetical protein
VEVNINISEMKEDNSTTCANEGRTESDDKEKKHYAKDTKPKKMP